jgi:predicted kinase
VVVEGRPFVIAVGGVPGSGKTSLARALGTALHVPVLVRDELEEGMHVTARSEDPADVRRFSGAAFEVFWSTVRDLARAGVSLVAEAAYHRDHSAAEFEATATLADLVLVWCRVDPGVALARYRARAPLRHPAHADELMADRMDHPAFDWSTYDPPPGPWPRVDVETAEPVTSPSLHSVCRRVHELRAPRR